jgi:hypothetical protein
MSEGIPLTIYTTPKPFVDHTGYIQRNAIKSWTRLIPRPEIILYGDSKGSSEISRELGLKHVPIVKLSPFGTPLVSDMYRQTHLISKNWIFAYINSDIIVFDHFMTSIDSVASLFPNFLIIGQRWNLNIDMSVDYDNPDWIQTLKNRLISAGTIEPGCAIDYFIFARNIFDAIPALTIGRAGWDNWFVYNAIINNIPVIDATKDITVIHQNHGYGHLAGGAKEAYAGKEASYNMKLGGPLFKKGYAKFGFTEHATWEIENGMVAPRAEQLANAEKIKLMLRTERL